MDATPLFTVITVCFNTESTIAETMESVLRQDFQDYEYWVVDGGSTDGTAEIIRRYEARFSGRMHWLSEKDNGMYDAINKALRQARGKYVNTLNSGDRYLPHTLRNVAEAIAEKNLDADVFYGAVVLEAPGRIGQILRFNDDVLPYGMPPHPASFIARQAHLKWGGYSDQYKIYGDWELFLRFYFGKAKFVPIEVITTYFAPAGLSGTVNKRKHQECYELSIRYHLHPKWICIYNLYSKLLALNIRKILKRLRNR